MSQAVLVLVLPHPGCKKRLRTKSKDSLQRRSGRGGEAGGRLLRSGCGQAGPPLCNESFADEVQRLVAKGQVSGGAGTNILVVRCRAAGSGLVVGDRGEVVGRDG